MFINSRTNAVLAANAHIWPSSGPNQIHALRVKPQAKMQHVYIYLATS